MAGGEGDPPLPGVDTHFRPTIFRNPSPIVTPVLNGRVFEIRPQYLAILPTFRGVASDEPYTHLIDYAAICSTIGKQGFTLEEVKLRVFQFSLKDRAKQWFSILPSDSIRTWDEMQRTFLEEYYPMSKTSEDRNAIKSFSQHVGETFHEAFKCFNEMLRMCPHHDIPKWDLVKIFYDGLVTEDQKVVFACSGRTFLTHDENYEWNFLETLSKGLKIQASADRSVKPHQIKVVNDQPSNERFDALEKKIDMICQKLGNDVSLVSQVQELCEICGDMGHVAFDCPMNFGSNEEVNQIHGERNMNSNTYHPGLRNHPNFRYGNPANQMNPNFQGSSQQGGQQQFQPRQQNFQGILKGVVQEQEVQGKTVGSLTQQVGQLAEEVAIRRPGKLPSDTAINPQHQGSSSKNNKNAHVNEVCVLRNGKSYENNVETPSQFVEGVVEDVSDESDNDQEIETHVTKTQPHQTFKNSTNQEGVGNESTKVTDKGVDTNTAPYPSALVNPVKASIYGKRGPQSEEMWDVFKQVKINLPLIDAIRQIPSYAKFLKDLCTQKRQHKLPKKLDLTASVSAILSSSLPQKLKDPGAPLISIQVGDVSIKRALLDLGASVSILPGSLYDQHDFGPLKKTDITVVMADMSPKLPRGMLHDFGDRELRLNMFANVTDPFVSDDCLTGDITNRCVSPLKENHTKEECLMIDKSMQQEVNMKKKDDMVKEVATQKGNSPQKKKVGDPHNHINSRVKTTMFGPWWNEMKDLPNHWRHIFEEQVVSKNPTRPP
ncbi:uncharacterized protein LOC110870591 [Helianthus annuus]|uniref:uncharacterized protein LOC110870591 n=1 Tax=Helianthus annuus TaxID=4232 RepID=UPI000B8F5CB9|nr:uncharacterized protein LOC110870591 [Helianthus annuus]